MSVMFHPYANLFPLIEGDAFLELVEDVRTHGVREKIKILDDMILDGRNRYRAALAAGLIKPDDGVRYPGLGDGNGSIKPPFVPFVPQIDGDPLTWVLSKNLHRRHLTESQRAMVAAELATMRQGERTDLPPIEGKSELAGSMSQKQAAELMHTSVTSVERAAVVRNHGAEGLAERVKQGEMPVSVAESIARLPVSEQIDILRGANPKAFGRVARERRAELEASGDMRPMPRDSRAVMSSRVEPPDSLDYFPTPPWATRALMRHVLPELGESLVGMVVHEPACGEGHIAGVLQEEALSVLSTDIFDYSFDGCSPPGWVGAVDYLAENAPSISADWKISNPPFEDKAQAFVLKAFVEAKVGVAMFVRLTWLDSIGRYEQIFRDTPPTVLAIFVERVNLCKGRWDPEGSTATQYCWLVWVKGQEPRAPFWIPPGQRVGLTMPDDVERFTAHPVRPNESRAKAGVEASVAAIVALQDAQVDLATQAEVELVSRVDGGRTPSATSEFMDATAGETAPVSEIPEAMMLSGVPGGVSPAYIDAGASSTGQSAPFKSTPVTDAVIRRDDAAKRPIAETAAELGCKLGTLKKRRSDLGLTSMARVVETNRARARQ